MEMIRKYFPIVRGAGDDDADFFITTLAPDLEGDRVFPDGIDYEDYAKNPLILYLHDAYGRTETHGLPIGTVKALEIIKDQGVRAKGIDWMQAPRPPLMDWIQSAWQQRKLRGASIGFVPIESRPNAYGGRDHMRWKLLEFSLVPLPMNPQALRLSADDAALVAKALGLEKDEADVGVEVLPAATATVGEAAVSRLVVMPNAAVPALAEVQRADADPMRWNRALSKAFDVTRERFEPMTVELAMASRYLDTEIKDIYQGGTFVPSPRMGSFLSALDEHLVAWTVEDVRNLTHDGKECPPVHDVIELNSKLRQDFLVDGARFMRRTKEGHKLVLRLRPNWYGLDVTTYAPFKGRDVALGLIEAVWRRAKDLNFLKGEAFALSGEFIRKTDETWDDLFLTQKNDRALRRVVDRINDKGADLENRGVMLMGEAGTGKTMGGRIIRNTAAATFIWVSARDFYRAGAFGGFEYAFEMARECAPSILFFEDVDNWLGGSTVDLLKTQMDGIAQSRGVVTILTTNFPERMPEALIDRPGRFHDVLRLTLPDGDARGRMIARWLPELDEPQRVEAIKATEGYSGAHIRELANFVKILRGEESLSVPEALVKALEKLREQRELITSVQTAGSRYRPAKGLTVASMVMKTMSAEAVIEKGVVPGNPNDRKADEGTAWSAPTLSDFTGEAWGNLSDAEKGRIAKHFAWAKVMPPEAFGDLKLPHHSASDGAAVWRGCAAAMAVMMGGRGGVSMPAEDRRRVIAHLAAHYRQFDKEPPENMEADISEIKMPTPEEMPPHRRPMAEHVKSSHEYLTMAIGQMGQAAAVAAGAGDDEMADDMMGCAAAMVGCAKDMAAMASTMGAPEREPEEETAARLAAAVEEGIARAWRRTP